MTLTQELVEHIAELARLDLSDKEMTRYRQQLSAILEYFEALQAIDTDNISPTSGMQEGSSMLRPDDTIDGLGIDDVLSNAPDIHGRQFRVPPIFN
ncbi:MAG: Asp-tRNA(Asn)/Glu-tRNA(Gln) amidotransferase subunit GatC [Anaerolineales bacterium]|nr:Asp-tRNA(Asn)/Glu-tRNA(Gln) amidotransferase subunit GatC [Chloroflexota bacterium]MBL6981099.1 Asp-tRNA(Asn)/Glu-tRNA(Gln) amidotransferase subunit GatC [Anaerolineales bacterium]